MKNIYLEDAISGLREYYEVLDVAWVVAMLQQAVPEIDTGNAQTDYEATRDMVEAIVGPLDEEAIVAIAKAEGGQP